MKSIYIIFNNFEDGLGEADRKEKREGCKRHKGRYRVKVMIQDGQWEWKVTKGYDIDEENGIAVRCMGSACTLRFYLAEPGDLLRLMDKRYEYAIATYASEVEMKYIYTYDYQPEESWTKYRHDFCRDSFAQKEYVFQERVFFRVVIRRIEETKQPAADENTGQDTYEFSEILMWERQKEIKMPERREYQRQLKTEAEETIRTVCGKQQADTLNFFLMTDSHYTVNGTWEDTVHSLQQVAHGLEEKGIRLDGFLHLGDVTDGLVPKEITEDYVRKIQKDIRQLNLSLYYVLGNHDANYFRNNPERFSEEEIRALYMSGREMNYYFEDFPKQSLRMIFLESFDPEEKVRYGFSDQELDWLERLLKDTPAQWYILIYSHVPPVPRLHYWSKEIRGSERLLRILRSYQTTTRENTSCGDLWAGDEDLSGAAVKAGQEGHLLGFIHGHNHADQIDYEEGFPIVSLGCNKCEYFEEKKPEGAIAHKRVPGQISQDLWDVLAVSVEKGTLDFVRFGAGEDRHIQAKRNDAQ